MKDIITSGQERQISQGLEAVRGLVIDGLNSPHSKAMYSRAIDDFIAWREQDGRPFVKATVNAYKSYLLEVGYSPATINQRLSAIRKLADEAADNGIMDQVLAQGVKNVSGVTTHGVRVGNWLTEQQAQKLIRTPDLTTLKGLRDRAILAVMLDGGLRRSEVARLTFDHVQMRSARWAIVDLVGKGRRVRTVPIQAWVKVAIDEWTGTANITEGRIFRSINKGDNISGDSMTAQAVADVVKTHAESAGFENIAAHDLRRTYAKLADEGGAPTAQIQLTLGHSSVKTTEGYLNKAQNLTSAPCDYIGLHLE